MPLSRKRAVWAVIFAVLLTTPVSLWALWKPIRALAPEWAGVNCYSGDICTDDPTKANQAFTMKTEALTFVRGWAGNFEANPKMIFCTSLACDRAFGFKGNAAYHVGVRALVISSRGWQPHYVRHELIHCVQVERIGGFRMLLHTPRWLIEGMAYSVSGDPKRPLAEPWESYRMEYEVWSSKVPQQDLWSRAAAL